MGSCGNEAAMKALMEEQDAICKALEALK
jgi:hypothetical protein